MGGILLDLAAGVRLSAYRKQVRGPKRPQPKRESGAKIKHVSTAKLLEKRGGEWVHNFTFRALLSEAHLVRAGGRALAGVPGGGGEKS